MSKQLREHIRTQLKTILESKYGYYKDKDGRIKQGDLAQAWKERIKSAVEDEEDRKDLSLKNVMKGIKDEEDIKEATPEEVTNAKKILDLEKLTTQEKKKQSDLDNMEEAELSPKQKKIAQAAPPPDKITGADFAALKSKKKLKEYSNEMIPSLLEVDEEEELEGEFPEE